jgi:hypothetical protein
MGKGKFMRQWRWERLDEDGHDIWSIVISQSRGWSRPGSSYFRCAKVVRTGLRFRLTGIKKYGVLISGIKSWGLDFNTLYKFKVENRLYSYICWTPHVDILCHVHIRHLGLWLSWCGLSRECWSYLRRIVHATLSFLKCFKITLRSSICRSIL